MSNPRIKAKIEALLSKTRAAGCTEAEALAAAELAARLMAEHGIDLDDLNFTEASAPEKTTRATWRSTLAAYIVLCTNCAAMREIDRDGENRITFIGRAPGPEIAVYLRDVCQRAVERAIKEFKAGDFYRKRRSIRTQRAAVADFVSAMVQRLGRRLLEIFGPLRDEKALADARAARERRFGAGEDHKLPAPRLRFNPAAVAGIRAGEAVPLNHGVTTPERKALA
jgi:hypothetical protein